MPSQLQVFLLPANLELDVKFWASCETNFFGIAGTIKAETDLASITKSAKCIFSYQLATSLSLLLSFPGFGAHLAQNNTAQEQP